MCKGISIFLISLMLLLGNTLLHAQENAGVSVLTQQNDSAAIHQTEDLSIILDEILVTGNGDPKITATGEVYRLSADARKSGDPYRALSEIPALNVDISARTVKTREGDTPLVLIDSKLVNSGLDPIDPKFIESVELIEVMNAKYLQMGVSKILDIKLKRDVPRYTYVDLRTRHDLPVRNGFASGNFEHGSSKFAVSGLLAGFYLHNDRSKSSSEESLDGSHKHLDSESLASSHTLEGSVLIKWTPSASEFFSGAFKGRTGKSNTHISGSGIYNSLGYSSSQHNNATDGGWLAALFHEHTFSDGGTLSTFTKFNRGIYDTYDMRTDIVEETSATSSTHYKEGEDSRRNQYTLSLDYEGTQKRFGTLSGGYSLEYTSDHNKDSGGDVPAYAKVGTLSNYAFFSYAHTINRLFLTASAGVQYMRVATDAAKNSWWRPRASANVGMRLPKRQTLRLLYYLDNSLPGSGQLQTFNRSTDPWLKTEGNPYLVPVELHTLRLTYDKGISSFNIRLYGGYNRNRNMIESYIRQEKDIAIQSYRNYGSYSDMSFGGYVTFRKRNLWISASSGFSSEKYSETGPRSSFNVGGNFKWDFGNFFIYGSVAWRNKAYTPVSETRYLNPTEAHVQIAWQISKNLYASLGLPYFWGVKKDRISTQQDGYCRTVENRYSGMSLRPWLLISWTIRKNTEHSIQDKMPNI